MEYGLLLPHNLPHQPIISATPPVITVGNSHHFLLCTAWMKWMPVGGVLGAVPGRTGRTGRTSYAAEQRDECDTSREGRHIVERVNSHLLGLIYVGSRRQVMGSISFMLLTSRRRHYKGWKGKG